MEEKWEYDRSPTKNREVTCLARKSGPDATFPIRLLSAPVALDPAFHMSLRGPLAALPKALNEEVEQGSSLQRLKRVQERTTPF